MARRTQRQMAELQHQAFSLLDEGAPVEEAAAAAGVSSRTVRRWRHERQAGRTGRRAALPHVTRQLDLLARMLRAEGPAVGRVILDLAKGGDVRAAALVVRLLGSTLTQTEGPDDRDVHAAFSDLEQQLDSLPPAIASEIVGLLAEAQSAAAGQDGGPRAPASGPVTGPRRLPWQEEDPPPDQGDDPL